PRDSGAFPTRRSSDLGMAINEGKLLQRATVDLLQTPQRLTSGEDTGYGLGWDLETVMLTGAPARAAGHNGATLGGMVATLLTFRSEEHTSELQSRENL